MWIQDDYSFGTPVRAFYISPNLLAARKPQLLRLIRESPNAGAEFLKELIVEKIKDVPLDAQIVRMTSPADQTGMVAWMSHPSFPKVKASQRIPETVIR